MQQTTLLLIHSYIHLSTQSDPSIYPFNYESHPSIHISVHLSKQPNSPIHPISDPPFYLPKYIHLSIHLPNPTTHFFIHQTQPSIHAHPPIYPFIHQNPSTHPFTKATHLSIYAPNSPIYSTIQPAIHL